jgi:hypothetical protein
MGAKALSEVNCLFDFPKNNTEKLENGYGIFRKLLFSTKKIIKGETLAVNERVSV